MTTFELVSFKLCPYVQRSVITLLEKQVDYNVTYIDLSEPPEWFLALSPFGKVPLLRVGDSALFESAVINEYIDEITPPSLHPTDPLLKAQNRAWIEFGSDLLVHVYQMVMAPAAAEFEQKRLNINNKFNQLEKKIRLGPFFNGEKFSLVDCAYAPLFKHIDTFNKLHPLDLLKDYPKIGAWSKTLLSRPAVTLSVGDDFDLLYTDYLKKSTSYIAQLIN